MQLVSALQHRQIAVETRIISYISLIFTDIVSAQSVVWNCLPHGLKDDKSGLSLVLTHGFLEHNYSGASENVVEVTLRKSTF